MTNFRFSTCVAAAPNGKHMQCHTDVVVPYLSPSGQTRAVRLAVLCASIDLINSKSHP